MYTRACVRILPVNLRFPAVSPRGHAHRRAPTYSILTSCGRHNIAHNIITYSTHVSSMIDTEYVYIIFSITTSTN